MRPRGPLAPGPIAILMVALIAVPEVLRRCKPLAKGLGDFFVNAGKECHRLGELDDDPTPPPSAEAPVGPAQPSEPAAAEPTPPAAGHHAPKAEPAPETAGQPEPGTPKKRSRKSATT